MSRITSRAATEALPLFATSTDIALATLVGSVVDSPDGREWMLVQNGGTALAAGTVIQSPAATANHLGLTVTAFTAYSANGNQPAQVTATMGGTGVLPNEYAGGFAIVNTGTGLGQTLKIASHKGTSSTTGSVVFTLEDSPAVALDATSTISLYRNPAGTINGGTASSQTVNYSTAGVVVSPATTLTGQTLGVCVYAIPASTSTVATYGWIQKAGLCSCLNQGGTTVYRDVMVPGTANGAVATYAVANGIRIGFATQTGTDAQQSMIVLKL
ncbi:MAG: hypothetical protein KGJ90_02135 [Patescibacteria group bacterium]|nr:hypothetical protein [Patescibacteria group bacterium]